MPSEYSRSYTACPKCGTEMTPVMYTEHEYMNGTPTGRIRKNATHLACKTCGNTEPVNGDAFAGPWE